MERQVLTHAQVSSIVRRTAMTIDECRHCFFADVVVHEADDEGCNWSIGKSEGGGCVECLEAVRPIVDELRRQFLVESAGDGEAEDFLTTWSLGPR